MKPEEFITLSERVSNGSASTDELREFNSYYNQIQQQSTSWENLPSSEKEMIKEQLQKRIVLQIHPNSEHKTFAIWPRVIWAAAMLMVLSLGLYIYNAQREVSQPAVLKTDDIEPGKGTALLTLSDGRKIGINNSRTLRLEERSGVIINKTSAGELIYTVGSSGNATGSNMIETPVGGEYRVRLSDGTVVWLNASSSLRYPLAFAADKRIVEIKGEAYFEVAHDAKRPFIVRSAKQDIQVLGTRFNVMAYADEAAVETTLVQGSVKINTSGNTLTLKPGEQSQVFGKSAVLNREADIESALARKNGKIQFEDMDIQHIMRMLSRWYNFDVEYKGTPVITTFGGSFSRSKSLSIILNALQSTGDIHFKIEGRRVVVMP